MAYNTPTMWAFWGAQAEWSEATFGTIAERGPIGPLKHLKKEVDETLAKPHDLEEYADMLFLLVDATRRAGFTYDQWVEKAFEKLEKNKKRTWAKPTASDEPVEHIREETPECECGMPDCQE